MPTRHWHPVSLIVYSIGSGVLLFEVASLSRTVAESKMHLQASWAASVVNCLQLLEGGHLAVSISLALLESSRVVPEHVRGAAR